MRLDLLLRGGTVIDGTGGPPRTGDVGVAGGRIVLPPPGAEAETVYNASGLVVAPGFIDAHTHSDAVALLRPEDPDLTLAAVRQGVTTEIAGNCGKGLFPALPSRLDDVRRESRIGFGGAVEPHADFRGFAAAHTAAARANHITSLVGHGTLRAGVLGYADRAATQDELAEMCRLLDAALADGAPGLSTGLIYTPGTYADTAEVAALAAVTARHGRPYVTHLRDEMSRVEDALEEAVEIARRGGAALHVSHHKTAGVHAWGRTGTTLARLAGLRADGMDVTCDVYPYTAASTALAAMLPPWANDGGEPALAARLRDPAMRDRMRTAIAEGVPGWENTVGNGGWDRISVACAPADPDAEGHAIADLAVRRGGDPLDVAAGLLLGGGGPGLADVTIISHSMREDDVQRVLACPFSMIGSDGVPKPGLPHPRWAGTFARVLGRYVRDLGVLPLETAVHKMTGMAAVRFGLAGRGVLRDGAHADLAVFDPAAIADEADFPHPLRPPAGMRLVVVDGKVVVRDGADTGARPGTVLRAA
ncbi:MAG TPA: D-aminoacylase [Streptosporangiaceae bacterium]